MFQVIKIIEKANIIHWGKADDRNCNYGHVYGRENPILKIR
jgi:hypothetical protein